MLQLHPLPMKAGHSEFHARVELEAPQLAQPRLRKLPLRRPERAVIHIPSPLVSLGQEISTISSIMRWRAWAWMVSAAR